MAPGLKDLANAACAAASTLAVTPLGRVAFIIVAVGIRAITWRMSLMQVPPSAARATVETKPAAKRTTKARSRVLTGWLSTFIRTAVSLLRIHHSCGLAVYPL